MVSEPVKLAIVLKKDSSPASHDEYAKCGPRPHALWLIMSLPTPEPVPKLVSAPDTAYAIRRSTRYFCPLRTAATPLPASGLLRPPHRVSSLRANALLEAVSPVAGAVGEPPPLPTRACGSPAS